MSDAGPRLIGSSGEGGEGGEGGAEPGGGPGVAGRKQKTKRGAIAQEQRVLGANLSTDLGCELVYRVKRRLVR